MPRQNRSKVKQKMPERNEILWAYQPETFPVQPMYNSQQNRTKYFRKTGSGNIKGQTATGVLGPIVRCFSVLLCLSKRHHRLNTCSTATFFEASATSFKVKDQTNGKPDCLPRPETDQGPGSEAGGRCQGKRILLLQRLHPCSH